MGDDEIQGGRGDDDVDGGAGNDVITGGDAVIVRDFNDDGTPRMNSDGVTWHRDIFLEETGVITGMIDADTTPLLTTDSELAAKLLKADVILGAGALLPNGDKLLNDANFAWDTELYLVDLTAAESDTIRGGSGDDWIFGQRGDDFVMGDAGNDLLVGDGGNNTLPFATDLPQVVSGIRLSGIAEGADVPLLLDAGGSVIVPALTILPEALTTRAPVLTQVPETVEVFERWAHDDALQRVDGAAMSAYVALVPDVIHSLEALPGNDLIEGGVGDDFIVGDDLTAYSPLFPGLDTIDAALTGLGAWTGKLQHLLHHLSIDFDLAEQTIGAGLADTSGSSRWPTTSYMEAVEPIVLLATTLCWCQLICLDCL